MNDTHQSLRLVPPCQACQGQEKFLSWVRKKVGQLQLKGALSWGRSTRGGESR